MFCTQRRWWSALVRRDELRRLGAGRRRPVQPRLERLEERAVPTFGAIGPEFRVNTVTTAGQIGPAVAMDADNDFVVAWASVGQDGGGQTGVYAQRYNSSGAPVGTEFQVNTHTTDTQAFPAAAMDADGDFVIAWTSYEQDGSASGVFAQRYSAAGAQLGTEFRVNTFTTSNQFQQSVAMNANGEFVVAWASRNQDGADYGVYARRYSAAGVPLSAEFRANTFTTYNPNLPTVAVDGDGDFVVAWTSYGQDGNSSGVFARRFSSAGLPQGTEFQVNTFTLQRQFAPAVAMDADGDFVVAWMSDLEGGNNLGIYAQRFNAAGVRQGGEFRVNTFTSFHQSRPKVAMDAAGAFIVTWSSFGQEDGSSYGIYAQRYTGAGVPLGGEFHVNSFIANSQHNSAVTADADGDFVVVWDSFNQDGSDGGIYAQRYTDLDANGDTAGPSVAGVLPAATATPLRPNERLFIPVTGLVVTYSEDVFGAAVAANYGLTRNGIDIGSRITGVVYGYNPSANRYEASLSLNAPLADGMYQLTVHSAIADLSGNRLDGRLNGSGFAADYALSFTVAGQAGGPEVRVNSVTVGSQSQPAIAANELNGFVVAWQSAGQDGDLEGIYAQQFSSSGTASGPELRINTFTTGSQSSPAVAMNASGAFVLVWQSDGQDAAGSGIYAQRYNSVGVPLGSEFRVNSTTIENQSQPAVAIDPEGDFVVVWQSFISPTDGYDVYAQRFNAGGAPAGGEFRVNSFTFVNQWMPAVAVDDSGNFVIAWESNLQDLSGYGVFAQRYSSLGEPRGGEFRVNQLTTNNQRSPSVAITPTGDFVVAWVSLDGADDGVYARRFSASGPAQSGDFLVNTFTTGAQITPSVAAHFNGDIVVTWQSADQDGGGQGVYGRRFNADNADPIGEFRINVVTAGDQSAPTVAMIPTGDFLVAWESNNQDGSGLGVYAQRFVSTSSVESVRLNASPTAIDPGGVVVAPVTQALATFLGFVQNTGAGSAANIANWQLARYGVPVAGAIAIIDLAFNPGVNAMEATLSFTTPLADGRYTLTALPSVLDVDGRPLDGDFDGTPGGAFVIAFDVKPVPPRGSEIPINQITTDRQGTAAVAADAVGNYVVAWASNLQDGSGDGVYARRYSAAGVPLGPEFRVNTFTGSSQNQPAVAMDSDGDVVVVWASTNQDGSSFGVYGQRYKAAGVPQGSEFRVNTVTANGQLSPAVSTDAAGNFIVLWTSSLQDGSGDGVYAQRYSAAGIALGGEIRVNTATADSQRNPAVAMDADGDFIVAWASNLQDGPGYGVYAQRFSVSGTPLGAEFPVNTLTANSQQFPAIAASAAGDFVIAWQSAGQDGAGYGIYAQRFSAAGIPQGGEFRVNTFTIGGQRDATVAIDAMGDFIVGWESNQAAGADGSGYAVFAQRYAAGGGALGGETRLNTFTTGNQVNLSVCMDSVGDFVAAWQSFGQDGDGYGVYAQRYVANLTPTTNGLPNISIPGSPATNINLAAGFDDGEDGADGLTYTVVGNNNPGLFTSTLIAGTTLTATPAGPHGSALVTVRGTDSGGSFVETSFTITVAVGQSPIVAEVQINGGAPQRSRVTNLTVTFSTQVTFATTPGAAFTLVRSSDNATATFSATAQILGGVTVVTLDNFAGAASQFGSLADGRFTLTALANQISTAGQPLDGNGDGTGGDNFVLVGNTANKLFRLFGDADGDNDVDTSDFGAFRTVFGGTSIAFDFDNDGDVDTSDFGAFRTRFGVTI